MFKEDESIDYLLDVSWFQLFKKEGEGKSYSDSVVMSVKILQEKSQGRIWPMVIIFSGLRISIRVAHVILFQIICKSPSQKLVLITHV